MKACSQVASGQQMRTATAPRRALAIRNCQAIAPPRTAKRSSPQHSSSRAGQTPSSSVFDSNLSVKQPSSPLRTGSSHARRPDSDDVSSVRAGSPTSMSIRSSLASVVAAAHIMSAPPPNHSPSFHSTSSRPLPPTDTARVGHAMTAALDQAAKAAASTVQTAKIMPAAAMAMAQAASSALTAALSAAPRGLGDAAAGVAGQWSEDITRLRQAWTALHSRGSTVEDLKAKVEALQGERDSLAAQLHEAQQRLKFTESVTGNMAGQLEEKKALQVLDSATQVFRRHIGGVPGSLSVSEFTELQEQVIGKGGCATVYRWQVGDADWAVKADPITHRHSYAGDFDPQRCGDLLPAFLPPHANIMAPRAWWVAPLPAPAAPAARSAARTAPTPSAPAGFKLYTLYERYTCSLWEHLQSLHTGTGGGSGLLLDLRSLLTVVRDVAAALEHLAQHRVVHGDVKMENVLLVMRPEAAGGPRVAKAVLIDFGLCCMLPAGEERMPARGGTWLFKAPEQMTGPPGISLGGQERSSEPHVELQTDVWALGALICMLCNNGELPSKSGLPFSVAADQLAKWGDRPKGGSMEPFYMLWDDILPKVPPSPKAGAKEVPCVVPTGVPAGGCAVTESAAGVQQAHVMALLRRLAWGCMQVEPGRRLTAGQVRAAAAEALEHM